MPAGRASLAPLLVAACAALAASGAGSGARAAGAAPATPIGAPARGEVEALAAARERSARAEAAVAALKRDLATGHASDATLDDPASLALQGLRADYADMQRRAAGYRATLGEHHPTLATAEMVLTDIRSRIVDETRRSLGRAEREAAQARAALGTAERGAAVRSRPAADVTGSLAPVVAPLPRPAPPPADAVSPPAASQPVALDVAIPDAPPDPAADADGAPVRRAGAALAVLLALTATLWAAVSRGRRLSGAVLRPGLRSRREPVPPASAAAVAPAAPPPAPVVSAAPIPAPAAMAPAVIAAAAPAEVARPAPVPLLAKLPLPAQGALAEVAVSFVRAPAGALARQAGALDDTLRAAIPAGTRMTVLVARTKDVAIEQGDAAALALALAAATRGRRVALMEARSMGRLRRSLLPADAAPVLVDVAGAARTAYRFVDGGAVVLLLPSDDGEAEAAAAAARREGTLRLSGLDVFDTVVMVGESAAALARGADLVVIATGPETAAATIAAVARPCIAAGRTCGTLVLEPAVAERSSSEALRPEVPRPEARRQARPPQATPAGRRIAENDLAPAPLALRGTFGPDPARRVA